MDNNSSEPRAYALALVNPHNICYANAVLRMLHQARSREGLITGLGDLNGSHAGRQIQSGSQHCQGPSMVIRVARVAEANSPA